MTAISSTHVPPLGAMELYLDHQQQIFRRTDRLFAWLMLFQWLAGIFVARIVSPLTWAGASSRLHPHVITAIVLGGAISLPPIFLGFFYAGQTVTRYWISVSQMLTSALLIHLTGGRIETHFHVFGSLAFLAFYRDWRVLDSGDDRRRRRSHSSRHLFSRIGLRRDRRQPMAVAGTRGLGGF